MHIENPTPEQQRLLQHAQEWRDYAATASPEGLARTCLDAAKALEMQAQDGIARCSCCFKPRSRGMWDGHFDR
jgi:hypothetical protein